MQIKAKEMHLWWCLVNHQHHPEMMAERLLSDEERARCKRLPAAGKRTEFLMSRVLARTALSHYLNILPEEVNFKRTPLGKPSLDPPCHIEFNLSNTSKLAVCMISASGPVGIDIEPLGRGGEIMEIADIFFSGTEREELATLDPKSQSERALSLWTLKEAFLKAKGLGIYSEAEKIAFLYRGTGCPGLAASSDIEPMPERWHFKSIDFMDHRIALAATTPFQDSSVRFVALKPLVAMPLASKQPSIL